VAPTNHVTFNGATRVHRELSDHLRAIFRGAGPAGVARDPSVHLVISRIRTKPGRARVVRGAGKTAAARTRRTTPVCAASTITAHRAGQNHAANRVRAAVVVDPRAAAASVRPARASPR
jgi:hypothetical protein